jgi:Pyoverdine/dityrosine biosynthesis protein
MSLKQGLAYRPGLDRIDEAVISSHFMHDFCTDPRLALYDMREFESRALEISESDVRDMLIPALVGAAGRFARDRANAARARAVERHASYGLSDPREVGTAEFITEVMFDRQFRRAPRETCSRHEVCLDVARRISTGSPVEMVIPALPYKFSSPLKTRGQAPDLAEVNFLLELYEIVAAVELLYRECSSDRWGPLAKFIVICDGSRFGTLINEPQTVLKSYRYTLEGWIERLGLGRYVELLDYNADVCGRMTATVRAAKEALRECARRQYSEAMWPLFDPCDMAGALRAAARIDPDPERANPQGRFVSLVKSLVFTLNYRSLERFSRSSGDQYRALYREMTGHIFEPFAPELADQPLPGTVAGREQLRREMLREVWSAAIDYVAEIKSDRELPEEPISARLPDHVRWTIHAKPGQLGLLSSAALGTTVQAWAGAAVFKRAGRSGIRLCTLPVLALEGAGAVPVRCAAEPGEAGQPLFYIYPDIPVTDVGDFLADLPDRLVRRRAR